ncbi:MAG: RNA polymerase sigma factor [Leifsonia sp.]
MTLLFDDAEPELWSRVRVGDPAAFGELFDAFRDRVFCQALRHTSVLHDAEDITALMFLEAWRKRPDVRIVDGSPLQWLLVTTNFVARNHAPSQRRHARAMARVAPEREHPDFSVEFNDHLDDEPRRSAVRQAFTQLSSKDQDVVSLCVLEELPLAQAAILLRIPIGTVKSRLSRPKRRLLELTTEITDAQTVAGGAK